MHSQIEACEGTHTLKNVEHRNRIAHTHAYINGWSLNVTCVSLVNINPQGKQKPPVFHVFACVISVFPSSVFSWARPLFSECRRHVHTDVQFPQNPPLSRMSAQVRIIVGSVKVGAWCKQVFAIPYGFPMCADLYYNF